MTFVYIYTQKWPSFISIRENDLRLYVDIYIREIDIYALLTFITQKEEDGYIKSFIGHSSIYL